MSEVRKSGDLHRYGRAFVLSLILLQSWYIARPYVGIVNDALHYTALALYYLDPATMARDVLFLNGHATYTVFPALQAALIDALGPGPAHLCLVLTGQALWLLGLFAVAFRVFGYRWVVLPAVVAALLFNCIYGPQGSLSYAETIATPRLFAEAATLHTIAAVMAGGWKVALLLGLVATALHPLIAAPGLLISLSVRFGLWRGVWVAAVVVFLIGLGLAVADVTPFDQLFNRYDSTWKAIVDELFLASAISDYTPADIFRFILPAGALVLSAFALDQRVSVLAKSVLMVTSLLCAISLIGDLLENVFIVKLHLWRSLWLLMVFGNLLAIYALVHVMNTRLERGLLGAAIAVAPIETVLTLHPYTTSGFCALSLVAKLVLPRLSPFILCSAKVLLWFAIVFLALMLLSLFIVRLQDIPDTQDVFLLAHMSILRMLIVLSLAAVIFMPNARGLWIAAGVSGTAFVSLPEWDIRPPWRISAEAGEGADSEVAKLLRGKTVYWEGGPEIPWLIFGEASYYSCVQSAGILADRESAIVFDRRGRVLSRLNTLDFHNEPYGYCHQRADAGHNSPKNLDQLVNVCDTLFDLDFIALRTLVGDSETLVWHAPEPRKIAIATSGAEPMAKARKYDEFEVSDTYIYDCENLRGKSAEPRQVRQSAYHLREG